MLVNLDYQNYELTQDKSGENIPTGITCQIKPLEFGLYQKILAFIGSRAESLQDETKAMAEMNDPELMPIIQEVLPAYCRNLSGLEMMIEGEKKPVAVADLLKYGAFYGFAMQIFFRIFAISTLNEEETETIKKSQHES